MIETIVLIVLAFFLFVLSLFILSLTVLVILDIKDGISDEL